MNAAIVRELDGIIASLLPELVELRHDLHAHPQLAYEETYAASRVAEWLTRSGVPFQPGVAKTGVVGWLLPDNATAAPRAGATAAKQPCDDGFRSQGSTGAAHPWHPPQSKAVLLRADMDALPIHEETGAAYASTVPGVMHACGHDGHTAMLVGAAAALARLRARLPRPVKFLFQPAEEGGAGALRMIEAGAMDKSIGGVDVGAAFALHCRNDVPAGSFGLARGPFAAASDGIQITVTGRGGHAAYPERCADPILAAAAVVTSLHTVVSRNVAAHEQAIVTIGQIHGGSKNNIIPQAVELSGTVRTYSEDVRRTVFRRIEEVAAGSAAAMGCRAEFRLSEGYPAGVNDLGACDYVARVVREAFGEAALHPVPATMGGEDFAYLAQRVPACFLRVGMKPAGKPWPEGHSPQFDFNDAALANGAKLLCLLALRADEM